MDIELNAHEARVLGCLMEKAVVTPEYYPLSLNALVNACNQKSSREPVMALDPGVVQRTVNGLVTKGLVMAPNLGGRVDKYQQRFCNTQFAPIQFTPGEFSIVCLLLLRGPQTPGEIKAHSGRLHEFRDTIEVEAALDTLMTRADGPFVARLAREPRRKDHAYAHLFAGAIASAAADPQPADDAPASPSRLEALETRVAQLEHSVAVLEQALAAQAPSPAQ